MQTPTPEIRQAFYNYLLLGLPESIEPETDISWPNYKFEPDPGRIYIAPACLFAETQIASLSAYGYERLSGIFQIGIYGISGQGEGCLDDLARYFTDLFRGGTVIEVPCFLPVSISRAWRSSLHFEDGQRFRPWVVVSASWQQFTPKGD